VVVIRIAQLVLSHRHERQIEIDRFVQKTDVVLVRDEVLPRYIGLLTIRVLVSANVVDGGDVLEDEYNVRVRRTILNNVVFHLSKQLFNSTNECAFVFMDLLTQQTIQKDLASVLLASLKLFGFVQT
jgi:hypothetical protein